MVEKRFSQTKFIRTDTLKKAYPVEEKNEKKETILLLEDSGPRTEEKGPKPMVAYARLVSFFLKKKLKKKF